MKGFIEVSVLALLESKNKASEHKQNSDMQLPAEFILFEEMSTIEADLFSLFFKRISKSLAYSKLVNR